jgi:5-methylcytosine-specific restriction protein A
MFFKKSYKIYIVLYMGIDKSIIKKNIVRFVDKIFSTILRVFPNSKIVEKWGNYYKKIEIAPRIFLSFQEWNSRKPFFLILWRGRKYLMELDLSRVIFLNDQKITWILNIPTRKENQQYLFELNYNIQKIDDNIVYKIYQQMKVCNGYARKTTKGYLLAENIKDSDAIDKLLEIISYFVKSDQEKDIKKDYELKVIEGQIQESKILGRKRNRIIVEERKKYDNFTCQACNFRAYVNGEYVIECHHKNPLRREQNTSLDDLVCLCPTCHRIAHRRENPYSVEEIKSFLRKFKLK